MNKNIFSVLCIISIIGLLSGCSSKKVGSDSNFGNINESNTIEESTVDSKYAFEGDFNGRFDAQETTKSVEDIENEIQKELAKIEETRYVEQESRENLVTHIEDEATGETVSLLELENEIVDSLTDKIINGEITNIEEIEKELSKAEYSDEFKEKLKLGCNELLDYWTKRNKELNADSIDPKLVEENEDLRFYTQTEYDELQRSMKEREEAAGGNIHKELSILN